MTAETNKDLALQELARQLLKETKSFQNASLEQLQLLAGDASGRQYYRLSLRAAPCKTVVMVLQGIAKGPAFIGDCKKTQEDAYAELSFFLKDHGILVPQLYYHSLKEHAFLVEDVGDVALWRFAKGELDAASQKVAETMGDEWLSNLFYRAIDIIALYQNIKPDNKSVAFQRQLVFENYRREISEFTEFYADPRGLRASEREVLEKCFDAICETLISFPKTLGHFDFNAWNLFIDAQGQIRVLDFQDACLVSPARDVVSLINDRGMDEILGRSANSKLLSYYMKTLKTGTQFQLQYDTTLLHWDFRVSGRFIKLCQKFNTDRYMQWVPGTLRRLGRTLVRSYRTIHGMEDLLEILGELSPEIKEGINDPWDFPALDENGKERR